KDDNDLCLRNDTFVSRNHANLIWRDAGWWLEDKDSTNGTFLENNNDFFIDERVRGSVPIELGQLFRVGRTWLRIQVANEDVIDYVKRYSHKSKTRITPYATFFSRCRAYIH